MNKLMALVACFVFWILALGITAIPSPYPSSIRPAGNSSLYIREDAPQLPERPASSGPNSFHETQFESLQQTGYGPAVDAMPVFLWSRTTKHYQPCYPESAIQHREEGEPADAPLKKNEGTHVPLGANPGKSCTDPGPYSGAYSLGNPFPIYVTARYCGNTDEWRINYDLYYVHDGILSLLGHRHDWEGITVVWQRDQSRGWWHRAAAIYNWHNYHTWYSWDMLTTVDVDTPNGFDVRDDEPGTNKKHPKVYVGFFSHASFIKKDDKSRQTIFNASPNLPHAKELLMKEYRSDDWWRLPRLEDVHPGEEIPAEWDYGAATSTPMRNKDEMCNWKLDSFP